MSTKSPKKSWTSFVELRDDLLKDGMGKLSGHVGHVDIHGSNDFLTSSVSQFVHRAKTAVSPKDFFDCLCNLSAFMEKMDQKQLEHLFQKTNLYILLISAIFTNTKFVECVHVVTKEERKTRGDESDDLHVAQKRLINIAVTLAFFPSVLALPFLQKKSIDFFRRHITKLIKLNLKAINDHEVSFASLCFKMENIVWNNKYHYTDKFPTTLDGGFMFETLKTSRSLVGISLLSLTVHDVLGEQLKISFRKIETDDRFNLSLALSKIRAAVYRIEAGVEGYFKNVPDEKLTHLKGFHREFVWSNERNLLYFIKEVSSGFEYRKDKNFYEVVLDKIEAAETNRSNLKAFAKANLTAFSSELDGQEREWANKVYITSIKAMTVLVEVQGASDSRWKVNVAIRELTQWIREVHEILNLYYLEDEWDEIRDFLNAENVTTEWKSTFFTPLEQELINEKAELAKGREIFLRIVKSILGMLNTEGGVIIVGLVEHPDRIVRKDSSLAICEKNGKSFFDVGKELELKGKNLDQVRLQILDNLKSLTQTSEEKFNGIFSLDPILIKSDDTVITVVKISVRKANELIFNVKEDQGCTWISLTKRADGKTIDVDARDYI